MQPLRPAVTNVANFFRLHRRHLTSLVRCCWLALTTTIEACTRLPKPLSAFDAIFHQTVGAGDRRRDEGPAHAALVRCRAVTAAAGAPGLRCWQRGPDRGTGAVAIELIM